MESGCPNGTGIAYLPSPDCLYVFVPKWYYRTMDVSEALPSPSELRSQAYHFLELAKDTLDPQLKRGRTGCAFAVSQLAECIEVKGGNGP